MMALCVPLGTVSAALGHASITVTKDIYGHVLDEAKRARYPA
jgi:integrase